MKFKVGDVVVQREPFCYPRLVGYKRGVVVDDQTRYIRVVFPEDLGRFYFTEEELELVK